MMRRARVSRAGARAVAASLVMALAAGTAGAAEADLAGRQSEAERQQAALRERIEALQKEIDSREAARKEAADALRESESAISRINLRLRELGDAQHRAELDLAGLEKQIAVQQGVLRQRREELAAQLRAQYTSGLSPWTELLSGGDPQQLGRNLGYLDYICAGAPLAPGRAARRDRPRWRSCSPTPTRAARRSPAWPSPARRPEDATGGPAERARHPQVARLAQARISRRADRGRPLEPRRPAPVAPDRRPGRPPSPFRLAEAARKGGGSPQGGRGRRRAEEACAGQRRPGRPACRPNAGTPAAGRAGALGSPPARPPTKPPGCASRPSAPPASRRARWPWPTWMPPACSLIDRSRRRGRELRRAGHVQRPDPAPYPFPGRGTELGPTTRRRPMTGRTPAPSARRPGRSAVAGNGLKRGLPVPVTAAASRAASA